MYYGHGAFSFTEVYNLPIWARKYYIREIIAVKEKKNAAEDAQMKKIKSKK